MQVWHGQFVWLDCASLSVSLDPSLCNAVTSCDPPVNALEDLVHSLNKGAIQFSAFVQCMRRHFQHLC